jgi:hypothetical protein
MTESKRDASQPMLGLYDRLVSAEESSWIDALTDARMALTSARHWRNAGNIYWIS